MAFYRSTWKLNLRLDSGAVSMKVQLLHLLSLFRSEHFFSESHIGNISLFTFGPEKCQRFDITLITVVTLVKEVNTNKCACYVAWSRVSLKILHTTLSIVSFNYYHEGNLRNATTATGIGNVIKGAVSRGFCCFGSILCWNPFLEALIINKMLL